MLLPSSAAAEIQLQVDLALQGKEEGREERQTLGRGSHQHSKHIFAFGSLVFLNCRTEQHPSACSMTHAVCTRGSDAHTNGEPAFTDARSAV